MQKKSNFGVTDMLRVNALLFQDHSNHKISPPTFMMHVNTVYPKPLMLNVFMSS